MLLLNFGGENGRAGWRMTTDVAVPFQPMSLWDGVADEIGEAGEVTSATRDDQI